MNRTKFLTVLPLGIAGLAFLACAGAPPQGSGSGANSPAPSVVGTTLEPEITLAEFDAVKTGMTYDEVTKIIGVPGEVTSEFAASDPQYSSKSYKYLGSTSFETATITFTGGRVSTKSQFGVR